MVATLRMVFYNFIRVGRAWGGVTCNLIRISGVLLRFHSLELMAMRNRKSSPLKLNKSLGNAHYLLSLLGTT